MLRLFFCSQQNSRRAVLLGERFDYEAVRGKGKGHENDIHQKSSEDEVHLRTHLCRPPDLPCQDTSSQIHPLSL